MRHQAVFGGTRVARVSDIGTYRRRLPVALFGPSLSLTVALLGLTFWPGIARLLRAAWWMSVFPGLAIALTVLAVNLLADGLSERLDPRLRRGGARRP
jgi:ABC-type dipeptide/oligopeptide/nickel transport system permease subunit